MSKKKTVVTPWRLVPEGGKVILKGKKWTVEKKRVDKRSGEATITIAGKTRTFGAKEKVELVLSNNYPDATDDAVKLAKKAHEKRQGKPPKKRKKPEVEPGDKWTAPADDKVGKLVEKKLKGKLVGVKPTKSEDYIVPLVDPSTIAAHLSAFHGVTPESRRYDTAKAFHDDEHARFERGELELALPHWHEERKPK